MVAHMRICSCHGEVQGWAVVQQVDCMVKMAQNGMLFPARAYLACR